MSNCIGEDATPAGALKWAIEAMADELEFCGASATRSECIVETDIERELQGMRMELEVSGCGTI